MNDKLYFKGLLKEIPIPNYLYPYVRMVGKSNLNVYTLDLNIPYEIYELFILFNVEKLIVTLRHLKIKNILNECSEDEEKLMLFIIFFLNIRNDVVFIKEYDYGFI